MYRKIYLFLLAASLLFLSGCRTVSASPVSDTEFVLNTTVTIRIYAISDTASGRNFSSRAQELIADSFALCRSYESVFSRTNPSSELYAVNSRKESVVSGDGSAVCTVSDDLAGLIALGLDYSEQSDGAFDITVAPLSDLWNFSAANPHAPSDTAIQEVLSAIGYQNISLDNNQLTVSNPDTRLDLGAVAKGYIADRIADYLRQQGVTSAILDLGGNILCIGNNPSGRPFSIAVQDPFSERGDTILTLSIEDLSVVSSGIYERCFTENGTFYHHILNPKTGYPYDNGLASVTILCASSADADALSTTCFSLGAEQGIALLDRTPAACGIFIMTDGTILYSEGADAYAAQ